MQRLPSAMAAASETRRESLSYTEAAERMQLINREMASTLLITRAI